MWIHIQTVIHCTKNTQNLLRKSNIWDVGLAAKVKDQDKDKDKDIDNQKSNTRFTGQNKTDSK